MIAGDDEVRSVMTDAESRIFGLIVVVGRSTAPTRLITFPDLTQSVNHRLSLIHREHPRRSGLESLDSVGCPSRSGQCGENTQPISTRWRRGKHAVGETVEKGQAEWGVIAKTRRSHIN